MTLRNLDYLTSKEGGKAFFVIFTAVMGKVNSVEISTPQELDDIIHEVIDENKQLYNDNEEHKETILHAIDELFGTTAIAQAIIEFSLNNFRTEDEDILLNLTTSFMKAAAVLNIHNERSQTLTPFSKRDFIRLAVLAYDLAVVENRNIRMIRGDSPGKFV